MTGSRWELIVAPSAERVLARLPEETAAAVVEFMVGPLVENPQRVGHGLHRELEGVWAARRGPYKIVHELDEQAGSEDRPSRGHLSASLVTRIKAAQFPRSWLGARFAHRSLTTTIELAPRRLSRARGLRATCRPRMVRSATHGMREVPMPSHPPFMNAPGNLAEIRAVMAERRRRDPGRASGA